MAYKRTSSIPIVEGGTGAQTLTNHGVLLGQGTSAISATSVGTTNTVLLGSTGADPSFGTVPNAALTNSSITLSNGNNVTITGSPVSLGGTATINVSGTTNHTVQVGNSTGSLTSLAAATTGQTLMGSTSADPAWTGSPSFSGSVTAATTLTATSGAITATSGNVVITSGNLTLATTSSSSVGVITIGGNSFISAYGSNNTFAGTSAGNFTLTASNNTGVGLQTLTAVTSGSTNCAFGSVAGSAITSGAQNTCIGMQSGNVFTTGNANTTLGFNSGSSWVTANSSNICIGNIGANESNTMRIGTNGSGMGQQSSCYIAGINGVTVTGTAVLCSTSGQLGTVASSIRFKENILDMNDISSKVFDLRPVVFNFKEDKDKKISSGLIAEEVDKIMSDLVVYDDNKLPFSVKYHELPVMLLNEIKKLRARIEKLEADM